MAERPTDQQQLVADCVRLWEAGELKLKPLGSHYRSVVARISAAENNLGALWRSELLGGPYGAARSAWQFLADTTITMLQETAENLTATGDVLVMASEEYQEAEQINTDAIKSAKDSAILAQSSAPGFLPKSVGEPR